MQNNVWLSIPQSCMQDATQGSGGKGDKSFLIQSYQFSVSCSPFFWICQQKNCKNRCATAQVSRISYTFSASGGFLTGQQMNRINVFFIKYNVSVFVPLYAFVTRRDVLASLTVKCLSFCRFCVCHLLFLLIKRYHYTHPFNGPLSRTTRVSRYQNGKTTLDFTEARDSEWQWHQLGHICKSAPRSRQITTPAPHYSSFLQARCPSQPTASKHWRQEISLSW